METEKEPKTSVQSPTGSVDNDGYQDNIAGQIGGNQLKGINNGSSFTFNKCEKVWIRLDKQDLNGNGEIIEEKTEVLKGGKIVIEGDFDELGELDLNEIEDFLRSNFSDYTLKINYVKKGSIEIHIEALPETLERIKQKIQSGKLDDLNGHKIKGFEDEDSKESSTETPESLILEMKKELKEIKELLRQQIKDNEDLKQELEFISSYIRHPSNIPPSNVRNIPPSSPIGELHSYGLQGSSEERDKILRRKSVDPRKKS